MLALTLPALAMAQPEIKSKAERLTITGRVHAQWFQSSIGGDPSNEFFIRRARATIKVKMNDMWSGVVQPDFGRDGLSLKGAFVRAKPKDGLFEITFGQTKRPFDIFELTSSTEHLTIERDGRIGRKRVVSLSRLTEKLDYSDRDIGVFVGIKPKSKRMDLYLGASNGSGANLPAQFSKKAYQARVGVQPIADQPWRLFGGVSTRPYKAAADTTGAGELLTEEKYASALRDLHAVGWLQEGRCRTGRALSVGHNWRGEQTNYDRTTDFSQSPPSFVALQGIIAYTHHVGDKGWFNSIRPVLRVSWADPNTDDDKGGKDDAGTLITPGFRLRHQSAQPDRHQRRHLQAANG